MDSTANLYHIDAALWAERQADALRPHAGNEIDWQNVAEEIEDVARRLRGLIESRLTVLCQHLLNQHLLKWQFQPEQQSGSWRGSIVEARNRIARVVTNNPSLQSYPNQVLAEAYADGRRQAEAETGLTMPAECPWTIDQLLDHNFWP